MAEEKATDKDGARAEGPGSVRAEEKVLAQVVDRVAAAWAPAVAVEDRVAAAWAPVDGASAPNAGNAPPTSPVWAA
jgi:hypothetical protein